MKFLRDLLWILPSSLVLGLVLSLTGPGIWWIGWLAFSILLTLGSAGAFDALAFGWFSSCNGVDVIVGAGSTAWDRNFLFCCAACLWG